MSKSVYSLVLNDEVVEIIDRMARIIPKTDIALIFSAQKKCPIMHGNIIPEE